jgi:hypothetical protein
VEGLAIELVDDWSADTLHNALNVDVRGSELEIHLEIDRQEKCLEKLRTQGTENGKMIAEWPACLTRYNPSRAIR